MSSSTTTKNPVRWASIPYLPVSFKYFLMMAILFVVGISGTSLSKFEAFALSFVGYSAAILLDRAEEGLLFFKNAIKHD